MDVDTDPVPATTAPPTTEHISSFLLHIRWRAAHMAVDPALGAATPVDTVDNTSRGHTQNDTSISGPGDDHVAGGNVAVATAIIVFDALIVSIATIATIAVTTIIGIRIVLICISVVSVTGALGSSR